MEVELKFQVGHAARAAVLRAVATTTAQRTQLRAIYFDTADDRLARAGWALRLRREGRRWVQTLKGRGDGLMQRLEHEVALPVGRGAPSVDVARHAGSAAGKALRAALGDAALLALYRTEIERLHRVLRCTGASVEIAMDEGRIVAGEQVLPVCELEFELKTGAPLALLQLAERWVSRHALWIDVRTKAERGWCLAREQAAPPPARAGAVGLTTRSTSGEAFAAMVESCLQHLLPNLAVLASGHGQAEHLHQWRVAVRRMRTVLREFAHWSADAPLALELEQHWRGRLAGASAARDDDVLAALCVPVLEQAGLALPPDTAWPRVASAGGVELAAQMRTPGLTVLVLQTWQLALRSLAANPLDVDVHQAARTVLQRAYRRAMKGTGQFADAPASEQHRIRKRLKRLRYAAEFVRPLLPGRSAREALAALGRATAALGQWNDLQVVLSRLATEGGQAPWVWTLRGWLQARREQQLQDAARALREFEAAPRLWR